MMLPLIMILPAKVRSGEDGAIPMWAFPRGCLQDFILKGKGVLHGRKKIVKV